jgi:diguanylate cyclase (GGDEF)-like protein
VSLRSKMLAMAAVPVTVLLLAVLFAALAQGAAARANEEVDRAGAMRAALSDVRQDLNDAESAVRAYLLTEREDLLDANDEAVAKLGADLTTLESLLKLPVQHVRLERIRELAEERLITLDEIVRLTGSRTPDEQAALDYSLQHASTISTVQQQLTQQMEEDADAVARRSIAARDAAYQRSYLVQLVAMPVALLSAMLLLLGFTARLVHRIGAMRTNAERLDAGLQVHDPDASKDELGQLSRTWSRTGAHLTELQEELRRLATIDPLTGLANRRGFFALAEHMLLVAARTRCAVALLFIDTDGLKRVNDELGHSVGDALLIEAADVIRETIRSSDVAGRIGGDEFCVLLVGDPDLDPDAAVRRLRDTEAAHNARPDRRFTVSMSIGLTSLAPGRSVTLEELIDAADEGMYADKRGRTDTHASASA